MYSTHMVSSVDGQHFCRAKLKLNNPTSCLLVSTANHVALNCQRDADGQNKGRTKPFRAFRLQGRL